MVGIIAYGAYIPWYRMKRDVIFSAMGWAGTGRMPGEKAVANYDEDSITMAVAAGMGCLNKTDREKVDALYFASTALPFTVRQNAGIISNAFDLRPDVRTADFTSSTKAGTTALLSACDAVKAGSMGNVMVCASDHRTVKAASSQELIYGDGAASFLVGSNGVIASLEGSYSISYDFTDHWKADTDKFERSWEERWIRDEGYAKFIPEAISGLLKKYSLAIKDFAKVIYACPYVRDHAAIGKRIGADPSQIQDNMFTTVGDTGTAHPLMMLVAALGEAKPGDKILLVSYGYGCDALFFSVTDKIAESVARKGIKEQLAHKADLPSYEKFLAFSNVLEPDMGIRAQGIPYTLVSVAWRDKRMYLGLVGSRCKRCGTPQYPYQRVCVNPDCGAVDEMEPYRFSDKKGHLVTYTGDSLAFTPSPPSRYGMVDFEGGGRFLFDIADCDLEMLKVGMPVEMTFRRKQSYRTDTTYGYFWKAVPIIET